MSSSLILQRFAEILNSPKVLTNPQEFLGLHYKKVLEFWERIEKLTQEQLEVVKERYWTFFDENFSEWDEATDLAIDASYEVIGRGNADYAGWAVEEVTKSKTARWATREILGNVENPTFLKMFDNL